LAGDTNARPEFRRVTIAVSVHAQSAFVAIHGVFCGGQNFEQVRRGTGDG
jgi:hypothetical protein